MITSRLRVRAFSSRSTFYMRQELVREFSLWGIKFWTTVLATEEVPQSAVIAMACFGDNGGWKSSFAHITEAWKE